MTFEVLDYYSIEKKFLTFNLRYDNISHVFEKLKQKLFVVLIRR
jgi:hypothetical protein